MTVATSRSRAAHEPGGRRHERLDDVFVRDMQAGTNVRVSVTASGQQHGGNSGNVDQNTTTSISAMNGDAIVFVSSAALEVIDTNNLQDAYVFRMSQPDPPGIEDYAYGYRTPDAAYRDIMSYEPGVRLQYFSNPSVLHAGQPLGIAAPIRIRRKRGAR